MLPVFLAIAAASPAVAQTEPEAIRLEYSAFGEDCPDGDVFFDRLRSRTAVTHARVEAARIFRVIIAPHGDAMEATLEVIGVDGSSTSRELSSESCDEIVSAVALVAALAIEEGRGERTTAQTVETRTDERVAPVRIPPAASHEPEPVLRLGLGALFEGTVGRAPGALFGAAVAVVLRRESDGSDVFGGPAFRASFGVAPSASVDSGSNTASFTWWTLEVAGCPVSWIAASGLFIEPCASVEIGVLAAAGDRVPNPANELRPWVSAGLVARVSWRFLDGLGITASTGFEVPLVRDRFYFGTGTTVLEVPAIAWVFDAGALWTFL